MVSASSHLQANDIENHCVARMWRYKLRATRVPTVDVQSVQVVELAVGCPRRDVRGKITRDNQPVFLKV